MHSSGTIAKRTCLALVSFALAVGTWAIAHKVHRSWVLQSAEDRMHAAYRLYASGSFEETTNAIIAHVQYINKHRQDLAGKLKVDDVLYVAHAKLSFMYAYAHDVTNAYINLKLAYQYHRIAGLPPVRASEFLDYIIAGTEKIDSLTGVIWKTSMEFPTNTVSEIRQLPL
jgi:hypothetical protein